MATRIAIFFIILIALGGIALTTSSSYSVTKEQATISAPSNLKMPRSPLIVVAASCQTNCINKHKKCRKSCSPKEMGLTCRTSCNTTKVACEAAC
jgi:hypothetical protein